MTGGEKSLAVDHVATLAKGDDRKMGTLSKGAPTPDLRLSCAAVTRWLLTPSLLIICLVLGAKL